MSNIINIAKFRIRLKQKRMDALAKLSDEEVEKLAMAGLADSTGEFCDKWIGKVDDLEAEIKAAIRKLDAALLADAEDTISMGEFGEVLDFDCGLLADTIGKEVREGLVHNVYDEADKEDSNEDT